MKRCLWPLVCPTCFHPLDETPAMLKCPQGHSFDISREGYVNLLLRYGKAPKIQGDAKPMLHARRRFLEAGHYRPLSNKLNELLSAQLPRLINRSPLTIVDAGCGEGYFAGQLASQLALHHPAAEFCIFGVDVAKDAARMASKRYRHIRFVVADIYRKLPFADHSAQILLNLFAPRNFVEFARLAAHPSILLIVIPSETHLQELRAQAGLLNIQQQKRQHIIAQSAGHFALDSIHPLTFELRLAAGGLLELAQMTPNYWHLSSTTQQRLTEIGAQTVTASFELLLFRSLKAHGSGDRKP